MSGTPPGYTVEEVRKSLKDLKKSHEDGCMEHCGNYVTIRLVTLIEQFCRIVYRRRRLKYDWKKSPRITIQILVDVFQRFKPGIEHDECEHKIRLFGARNGENIDGRIRLKSDNEVRDLVKAVLGKHNSDAEEWIRLYMLSFQSVKSIKTKLSVSFSLTQINDLNKLFGKRNAAVHASSDTQVDESAFGMVESLLKLINDGDSPRGNAGPVRGRPTGQD